MTYIIAGNFNNTNFLMSDCMATSASGNTFTEKLFGLKSSSDLYFTLSGASMLADAIVTYDDWNYNQKKSIDFEDTNVIRDVIEHLIKAGLFTKNIDPNFPPNQRLFFLNKSKVFFYDLTFESQILQQISKTIVPENHYALCHKTPEKITETINDIPNFCKTKIINYNQELNNNNPSTPIQNFKNRFSLIKSDNLNLIQPYQNFTELIEFYVFRENYQNVTSL